MKKLSAILGLSLLTLATKAALPQPDLIARIHFAGAEKISADSHARAFTNEFCSPEALALRTQTANRVAAWLPGWLGTNLNVTVADGPAKLHPLFDDLQTAEWFAEARAATNDKPELALAIKLDAGRAQLWQANLKPFFPEASFTSVDGWLIFDSDPALLKLGDRLQQQISTPSAGLLDLDINWPRLVQWYPELKELTVPETQFSITAPHDNFHIDGKFHFPQNLSINLEPWRIPTNALHAPFNTFTAVRGFAAWFQSQSWAQPYQITPPPNQLFVWSLPMATFQTYAAVPVPGAVSAFSQFYQEIAPALAVANAQHEFLSPLTADRTDNQVAFSGVPYAGLKVRALADAAGQFLFMEMFPNSVSKEPLPPQLFQRLDAKNLVYFHWEITSNREPQMLNISQLALVVTRHRQLNSASAAFKWVQKTGPTLGPTDTEIVQSGPAEFTFTRTAPGIFTASELYILANWLEAPNFPGFDIKLPNRHNQVPHPSQQAFPLTPIPSAGH